MPEGDSLYRYAKRLDAALAGKRIERAEARGPGRIPQVGRLEGATCTGARSHGKNVILSFDNGLALRVHLRMWGKWGIYAPGEPWTIRGSGPAHPRLILETSDVVAVCFDAPVVELVAERALPAQHGLATLGPDLLDEDFDAAAVLGAFRDSALAELTIGDAIMDQRLMAGVGNISKHETLFRCRLNPWRTVGELDDEALTNMITTARTLLQASVGEDGARRPTMYVYGKAGQRCRRCSTRILRQRQGRDLRWTAWCPKCQPGEAPSG